MSKLRILLLNERCPAHPRAGGAELHLVEVFSRLVARGEAEVTLLCSGTNDLPAQGEHRGLKIVRLGRGLPRFYLGLRAEARRRIAADEVDLIVEAHNKVPFLAPLYAGVPVMVIHHHLHGWTAFRQVHPVLAAGSVLLERLIPWVYRRCRVVAISGSSRRDLVRRGLREGQVAVVLCGIDHDLYTSGTLEGRPPTILSVGRLEPYKRVDRLIAAMPAVLAVVPSARLVIIGEGQDGPRLQRLAAELGLGDRVEFTGRIGEEQKVERLRRAALHVQCSTKEGRGLTVGESQACGVPVIAADVPGLSDSVQDGVTGHLVHRVTPSVLAAAIVDLLADEPRRVAMAERAQAWSRQLDWDAAASLVLAEARRAVARPVEAPAAFGDDSVPALSGEPVAVGVGAGR